VKSLENNLKRQVQFWGLIGPFITLILVFIILIKISFNPNHSSETFLALSALIGVPFCWKWKYKGFIFSSAVLMLVIGFQYKGNNFTEIIWLLGVGSSILLAWLTTVLSYEEVADAVECLQRECIDRRDSLWLLDESLQDMQKSLKCKVDEFAAKASRAEKLTVEREAELNLQKIFIETLSKELKVNQSHREKLIEELFHIRNELLSIQNKLSVAETEIANLNEGESQLHILQEIDHLKDASRKKEEVISDLQALLEGSLEENQQILRKIEDVSLELAMEREGKEANIRLCEQVQKEHSHQQIVANEMNDHIETLIREKSLLDSTVTHLQREVESFHNQLQAQLNQTEDVRKQLIRQVEEGQALIEEGQKLKEQMAEVIKNRNREEQDSILSQTSVIPLENHDTKALHRAHAMYKELRLQFTEKSQVLSETRSQLFHTQEALVSLQRTMEEQQKYQLDEVEMAWERHVMEMKQEMDRLDIEHNVEIKALHELISVLIKDREVI